MRKMQYVVAAILLSMVGSYWLLAQDAPMSFFVTSAGLGNGGNLGGLAGADLHGDIERDRNYLFKDTA